MNSIEIVLRRDSSGKDINLDNMSIEATESLQQILNSLVAIAKHEKETNSLDLRIGVEKGSACQSLLDSNGTGLEVVYNKILEVAENKKTRDNFYVKHLNVIHKSIEGKEDYSINYKKSTGKVIELTEYFSTQFKEKRTTNKTKNYFEIEFFRGKLMQNGGTNPNFHLQIPSGLITIDCTEIEAQKVNRFLYKQIEVSAWVNKKKQNKRTYKFCDLYVTDDAIKQAKIFESFFKDIAPLKGTKPLHKISDFLQKFYNDKDYGNAIKFLRIFNNKEVNPNYLKTILVLSKGLKDNLPNEEEFSSHLEDLNTLLTKIIKQK